MISKVLTRTAPLVSRTALGWAIWLGGAAAALAHVLAQLQAVSPWGFLVCLSLLAALGGLALFTARWMTAADNTSAASVRSRASRAGSLPSAFCRAVSRSVSRVA